MFSAPRIIYGIYLALTLCLGIVLAIWAPIWLWLWLIAAALAIIGALDLSSKHNVLRNYPILGHGRYLLEFLRPELRQYFFESEQSGRPFSREQRQLVYARADGLGDTSPFGTRRDFKAREHDFIQHSLAPQNVDQKHARLTIGGSQCKTPYISSRLNISAMSFGALSGAAVEAMNKGAKLGNFAQDTGEGAISPYHRKHGGDLIWEIASGYFGCRKLDGTFDSEEFSRKASTDQVKMVEIKLSQGAKPGHGGLLPAAKITAEIASTRDIKQGEDCLSPASHTEFSTPEGLLQFMQRLRELCAGKPVGFKLCIGYRYEFMGICKAMLTTGIQPDFITVDGAEGGTGAAPTELTDFVGTYINDALPFVDNCLKGIGKRDEITIIASGKVTMGFDIIEKMALGADMCNAARAFMFSVGCIQAMRCHTNTCPTGVATQDPARARALNVAPKSIRVKNYHEATIKSFLDLLGVMGIDDPAKLTPANIQHHAPDGSTHGYQHLEPAVNSGDFLQDKLPKAYAEDWQRASATSFSSALTTAA